MFIRRIAVPLFAAAALAVAGAGAAGAATHPHAVSNSTAGCASTPFCGGQEEHNSTVVWAVSYTGSKAVKNDRIIVQSYSQSRQDQDFIQKNVDGGGGSGGPNKRFEYAPNGDPSGLCISDINTASGTQLRLRDCNNTQFQDFTPIVDAYTGVFVGWQTDVNVNHVIQDTSFGTQGTVLTVGVFRFSADSQAFKYVT
jgi:hypothetical protein